VSEQLDLAPLPDGLGLPAADWQQPPRSVRLVVLALLKRLDALASRLPQDSSTSSRPPSMEAPHQTSTTATSRRTTEAGRQTWSSRPATGTAGAYGLWRALSPGMDLWSSGAGGT
jgi:hypothetical protein